MAVAVQVRDKVSFQKDIYSTLIHNINHQRDRGELCDVNLKLRGNDFRVHRVILAASSPYFRSMFTSKMREERSSEVDLSESLAVENIDSFRQILDFIYTGCLEINTRNVEDMLRIADFLLLDEVKDYCTQFYLLHGNLNLSNCLTVSVLAELHNLPEVAYIAKNIICARFHDYFIHSYEICELPESVLYHVLKEREIFRYASSDTVIKCILSWVRRRRECQLSLPGLLSLVPIQSIRSPETVRLLLTEPGVRSDLELVMRLKALPVEGASGGNYCKVLHKCSAFNNQRFTHISSHFISHQPSSSRESCKILLAANYSSAYRYFKLLLYEVAKQQWYTLPTRDLMCRAIPMRLTVCNIALHANVLYMYLSHGLPYPSDMLRVHVLAHNLSTEEYRLLVFRHCMNQSESCKTTLTDDRSVPPVFLHCRDFLVVIGNREGTGQIFLCDIATHTYTTYQIPGTRFVSLCRAVVKQDRYLYIWCRHRFGHEEYCIKQDVAFVKFDCKHKTFSSPSMPAPPGVGYGNFTEPNVLFVEKDSVILHSPGKPSLILDEKLGSWLTFHQKMPPFPACKSPVETPYTGCTVHTACDQGIFVLENPAAYTTAMHYLSEGISTEHPPPPADSLTLLTSGNVPRAYLESLALCDQFDDTFTRLIHNKAGFALHCPTLEDSSDESQHSESDSDFEYDDDLEAYYDDFD